MTWSSMPVDPTECSKKLLSLLSEFNKVVGYKIIIKKN